MRKRGFLQEEWVTALQGEVILQLSVDIYRKGIDQPSLSLEDTKSVSAF